MTGIENAHTARLRTTQVKLEVLARVIAREVRSGEIRSMADLARIVHG